MIAPAARRYYSIVGQPCRLRVPYHTRITTVKRFATPRPKTPVASSNRSFTQGARSLYPRKDSQDKDSINTEATEYSKSATDDEGARQQDAAFDPAITDPQKQKDKAGEGTEGTDTNNALDVSPANPDVSKQRGETEGGAESSSASSDSTSDRQRSSGGGGPKKGSKVA